MTNDVAKLKEYLSKALRTLGDNRKELNFWKNKALDLNPKLRYPEEYTQLEIPFPKL